MMSIRLLRKYVNICILVILITIIFSFTISVDGLIIRSNDNNLSKFDADIIIPDDFPTIQEGIDNANSGDEIFVRTGLYKENIIVGREGLTIKGENKHNTIIDAGKTDKDALQITESKVKIQGFTITNAWNEDEVLWDISGIKIFNSNITVNDNVIAYNRLGISVMASSRNLTITNNTFIDDGIDMGNYLRAYSLNVKDFLHNIKNNTVNGKPLYYYKNMKNFEISKDAGQVILANCSNSTIKDLYLNNCDFSITLGFCDNCTIENTTVRDTDGEVILFKSEFNIIQNNRIINNLHGICLDYKSTNNIVRNNYVSANWVGLSILTASHDNILYKNEVVDNAYGIFLSGYKLLSQYNNFIQFNNVSDNNIGIVISDKSFNNTIQNNSISKNRIGIQLNNESDGNIIKYNVFKRNILSAFFLKCNKNIWYKNYWDRPRILPKIIFGTKKIGNIGIPWFNSDLNPIKKIR